MKVKQLIVNCTTPYTDFRWWTVLSFSTLFTNFSVIHAISIKIVWRESKWCDAKRSGYHLGSRVDLIKNETKKWVKKCKRKLFLFECKMKGKKCNWAAPFQWCSVVFNFLGGKKIARKGFSRPKALMKNSFLIKEFICTQFPCE